MIIKVGTRGSKLALAQTNYVIDKLKEHYPEHEYRAVVIKTTGDLDLNRPLDAIGSKGIFVDEIEKALLSGEIQMAVHSMKDMPSELAEGLIFAKAWEREDPRDVLILKNAKSLKDLKNGANIATGSKRRSFQLLQLRPDLNICPIRGNIDSRLRKLEEGLPDGTELDGIVLAAAGLRRLGLSEHITEYLDADAVVPAPAQGTLAIELAEKDIELLDMVNSLSDKKTEEAVFLERGFLKAIGGDCHVPVGAYAEAGDDGYTLIALFGNEDGSRLAKTVVTGKEASFELIERAVNEINSRLS
jgi:hydroxymethylbilane synthase/uroporphyrinogen III methyltransferase/synthase